MLRRLCTTMLFTFLVGTAVAKSPPSQPLSAEELRAFVSGKTVREYSNGHLIRLVFYRPEGQAFLAKAGPKGFDEGVAGEWKVQNEYLCRPQFVLGRLCNPVSRLPDGRVIVDYGNVRLDLRAAEGDPDQLQALVEREIRNAPARAVAQAEERRGAVPAGDYLTGDEVRALITGKTIRETPTNRIQATSKVTLIYLAIDGTGYLSVDEGKTVWRGPWQIRGSRLCLQGAYWPCSDFRRTANGHIIKEYGGPKGSREVELFEGDPEDVVQTVSSSYPYNQQR